VRFSNTAFGIFVLFFVFAEAISWRLSDRIFDGAAVFVSMGVVGSMAGLWGLFKRRQVMRKLKMSLPLCSTPHEMATAVDTAIDEVFGETKRPLYRGDSEY
jgi:hypothetical protein